MIFFTADTHLGHANIIKHCSRPFKSLNEMDYTIRDNWNRTVTNEDTIYHLGDFAWQLHDKFFSELNGKKHLIIGNHDKSKTRSLGWKSVSDIAYVTHEGRLIVMCHYAMRTWRDARKSSWQLYGHSHGKLKPFNNAMDVGVDTHDFKPWSWEEVKHAMEHQQKTGTVITKNVTVRR